MRPNGAMLSAMDGRQIGGALLGTTVAFAMVLFPMTFPTLADEWKIAIWIALAILAAFAVALIFRPRPKPKAEATTVSGDKYTNHGVNNGHMGPINNYGKQPFQLTAEHFQQVEKITNKSTDQIHIQLVGSAYLDMGNRFAGAFKAGGYTIEYQMCEVLAPAPTKAFAVHRIGNVTHVTLAPGV